MGCYRPADACPVRNALDDVLYGAVAYPERIVQRKVPLDEGLHPSCKGNHPPLGLAPVRSSLSIDHEAVFQKSVLRVWGSSRCSVRSAGTAGFEGGIHSPEEVGRWSLTTLEENLVKIGAKAVGHGRYITLQMAETRRDAERELGIMSVDGRGVPRWGKNSPKRSEGSGLARRSAARSRKLTRSSMEVPFWLSSQQTSRTLGKCRINRTCREVGQDFGCFRAPASPHRPGHEVGVGQNFGTAEHGGIVGA